MGLSWPVAAKRATGGGGGSELSLLRITWAALGSQSLARDAAAGEREDHRLPGPVQGAALSPSEPWRSSPWTEQAGPALEGGEAQSSYTPALPRQHLPSWRWPLSLCVLGTFWEIQSKDHQHSRGAQSYNSSLQSCSVMEVQGGSSGFFPNLKQERKKPLTSRDH